MCQKHKFENIIGKQWHTYIWKKIKPILNNMGPEIRSNQVRGEW